MNTKDAKTFPFSVGSLLFLCYFHESGVGVGFVRPEYFGIFFSGFDESNPYKLLITYHLFNYAVCQ